nr:glycosyltransferase family 39 protein [Allocoleopsis franciscana]
MKTFLSSRWFHPLLLLVWIAIGAGLRFLALTGKPPWTDEFATLVFSLGNSFQPVPLDQAIPLATLLQPLQPNPSVGASQVIHRLITEDHHPPLYFVLAHWWMQLFPSSDGYVSLWAARSLPALLGVVSIPAVYGLGWLAFRSRLVAQLAAAMMAVSPYGVFLTQEARHYALGILWVIASLCCLVIAIQHLQRRTPLPIGVVLCWVVVNALGIATHYFFSLTLFAEAIALVGFWILGSPLAPIGGKRFPIPHSLWWRIYAVAAGTLVGCLVWVPVWRMSYDSQMTQWIMSDERSLLSLLNPIFQSLAAWITMLALLPVESPRLVVVITSGLAMLIFFIWAVPILYRGLKAQLELPQTRWTTGILAGFVLGAIALFFGITYGLGTDLTRGARYNFVYFPGVIVLLGAALAMSWNTPKKGKSSAFKRDNPKSHLLEGEWEHQDLSGKQEWKSFTLTQSETFSLSPHSPVPWRSTGKLAVALIWLMSFFSGITVISNLGYQKYYRPDLLVPVIQKASSAPILLATTHNTLVQTGEMMGLAWEFKRAIDVQNSRLKPQFLLAHQAQEQCVLVEESANPQGTAEGEETGCRASKTLGKAIAQLPRPFDLWLVNFKAPLVPEPPNCFAEDMTQYQSSVNGYTTRLYHCLAEDSQSAQNL